MSTINEMQDRTQKALDAFIRLSKAFTTFYTDEASILQIAYDHIKTVLNVQNFCVVLHDKRTGPLSVALAFQNGEPVREENLTSLLSFLGKQKIATLRKTQQPLLVLTRQAAEERFPDDPVISSFLGIPMNVGGLATDRKQSDSIKIIGMMIAYSDHEHEYDEDNKRWLEMFADMVSNEFESARQHQRFEVLASVQQRLALGKTEDNTLIEHEGQLLQLVHEQLQQLKEIDTRNLAIVLRDPKTEKLYLALWYQNGQPLHVESKEVRQQFFQQVRRSTIEKIVALPSGERLLLKNRKAVAEELLSTGNSEAYASWLGVPMRVKGDRVLGVFIVYHETQEYAYDEMDAQILDMVADQAAIALENLRLIDLEKKQRQNKEHARQQAEALKEVARIVSSSLDLKMVAEKIFDQLARLLEYTSVSLQAIENDKREIIGYRGLNHADYPPRLLRKLSEDRLISKIVESQKPIVLTDTKQSSLYDDFEETKHINSWIGAPLIVQDQVIGLLTVDHIQTGYYNQTTEELVVAFANQVAPALLNARLYYRLEHRLMERVNDFNALRNIYAAVGSSELHEVLQHILETGIRLTSSDYADIWLYNSETHEIREEVDYHNQRKDALYRQGSLRFNIFEKNSIAGHVIRTQTPYLCRDVTNDPYFLPLNNVKSELAVPIILRQEKNHEKIVLGVLNFESLKLDAFTDEHYQLIEALAEQAAIAINNARLTEAQQKQGQRQAALIELGKTLTSRIDVSEQDILNAIYQSTSSLMKTDTMFICLYDERTQNVRFGLVYDKGKPVDIWNTPKWQPRRINQGGRTEWIIREKKPLLLKTRKEFEHWYFQPGRMPHSGTTVEPSWLGVPMIVSDKVIGVISVHHDTEEYVYNETDRDFLLSIANQAAIALENARLYTELTETNQELHVANEELRELDRRKSEFVSIVSHELRTPLTSIKGYLENLLDNIYGTLNDEQRDCIEKTLERVNNNALLVANLLDLVRIQENRNFLNIELCNMTELIRNIFHDFKNGAHQKNITLAMDIPNEDLTTNIDKTKINGVITNLVHNAMKYTAAGGKITIKAVREKGSISVSVMDTGTGIPSDQYEKIFDRLYQIDSSYTRKVGGLGIGLYLVKTDVELHKGKIGIESQVGKGSTFTFTLPVVSTNKENLWQKNAF